MMKVIDSVCLVVWVLCVAYWAWFLWQQIRSSVAARKARKKQHEQNKTEGK